MNDLNLFLIIVISSLIAYFLGARKAQSWKLEDRSLNLHSLPTYHGYYLAILVGLPSILVYLLWSFLDGSFIAPMVAGNYLELSELSSEKFSLAYNEIRQIAEAGRGSILSSASLYERAAIDYVNLHQQSQVLKTVMVISISVLGFLFAFRSIQPEKRIRNSVETVIKQFFLACATIAILTTIGIVFSVLLESIEFFKRINFFDFVLGTHWSPQIAIRADQFSSSGGFGAVPIFWGTIFISFFAMLVAGPLGLISAIYLSEYADRRVRSTLKPVLEILAGIPTVVYGFFAAITIGPHIRDFGNWLKNFGLDFEIQLFADMTVSSESALAAGLVMGMMIIPFILSLSDDVLSAVPDSMRDGSTALGATKSETIWKVLVPAALPGIVGSFLLAISRAIGETMIVLMAAGVSANLTANPFNSVTTVTTQIVTLLTGDQEFDSSKTLAAFALALGLFVTTLLLNIIALYITRKYREQYE
jgi:phosphate transport system permease protein